MNPSPETVYTTENPWKQTASLPTPGRNTLILAGALYLLASLTVPLSFYHELFAVITWTLLLVGGFILTRRMVSGARLTLILSLLAFGLTGFSPSVGAVSAALCIGLMGGSFLLTCTRQYWLPVLLSAVAAGITYAVTGNWMFTVATLILLPATLLMSLATHRGTYRTTAICFAMGGFLLVSATLLLVMIWQAKHSVSMTAIREWADELRNQLIRSQIEWREESFAVMRETLLGGSADADQIAAAESIIDRFASVMTDEIIAESVTQIFNLFPAFLCVLCAIPAFLGQKMLNAAYASTGMSRVLTPECEFFTMSAPSAFLYILSTFATLGFSASSGLFPIVAENICIILLPGFLVIGARTFMTRFASAPKNMRWFLVLLAVFLFCCTSVGVFLLIALYGAYERVLQAIRRKIESKLRGRNGPNDGNGDNSQ